MNRVTYGDSLRLLFYHNEIKLYMQKKSIYLSVLVFSVSLWYLVCHFSFIVYENSLRGSAIEDIKEKMHNNLVVFESMEDRQNVHESLHIGPFKLLKNVYKSADNLYDYECADWPWLIQTTEMKEDGSIYLSLVRPVRIYSKAKELSQKDIINILLKAYAIKKNDYRSFQELTTTEEYNVLDDIKASFGYGKDVYLRETRNADIYGSKVIEIDGCKVFIKTSTDTVYSLYLKNDLDKTRRIVLYCGLFVIVLLVFLSYGNGVKYSFISKRIEMLMWVVIFAIISYIAFTYFRDNSEKTNEVNANQEAKFDEDIREYYPQIEQTADQIAYIRDLEIRAIDYANSSYYGDIEEIIRNSLNSLYASSQELRVLLTNAERMSSLHVAMKSPTYCKHDKKRVDANKAYKKIIWTTSSLSKMSAFDVHNNSEYEEFKNKCDSLIRDLRYQTTNFRHNYNFLFD